MTEALLVSNALLWALVLALGLVVVALTRQIGVLHERIAPVGALAVEQGPEVGEPAPRMTVPTLEGDGIEVGADGSPVRTLLFFLSPTCPVCKTLLPTLRRVARAESLRVLYASDGAPEEHTTFVRERSLDPGAYVLSRDLGVRYAVAKLPYAVLIGEDGTIRAKGLVNTREHVESLLEADRLGTPTLQAHLARELRSGSAPAAAPTAAPAAGAGR